MNADSLYPLLDALNAIEHDMSHGMWSFAAVNARHEAIQTLLRAVEQMALRKLPRHIHHRLTATGLRSTPVYDLTCEEVTA